MADRRSRSREGSRASSDLYPPGEGPPAASRKRTTSSRRSRSRSRSQSPRRRRGAGHQDDWNKSTQAFLQNLGATVPPPVSTTYPPAPPVNYPGYPASGGYPTGYGYPGAAAGSLNVPPPGFPPAGYGVPPSAPPPYGDLSGRRAAPEEPETSGKIPPERPDFVPEFVNSYRASLDGQHRDRKAKPSSKDDEDRSSSSSSTSSDTEKTSESKGMTVEQRDKLKGQQTQYVDAKKKLEEQLLKLKEEREKLKDNGAKHEDKIMRENAKLQKEVKTRIQYVIDVLGKIEVALKQPLAKEEAEVRKVRRVSASDSSPQRRKGGSKDKRKKKSRKDSSSSDNDDSDDRGKRKKKKKPRKGVKAKDSSSDSSSSNSESESEASQKAKKKKVKGEGVIQVDEGLFRMMTQMKSGSKGDAEKGDETLMGLLSKMSEAYMNSKKENGDLVTKVQHLENENFDLKKKLAKAYKKLDKMSKKKLDKDSESDNDEPKEKSKKKESNIIKTPETISALAAPPVPVTTPSQMGIGSQPEEKKDLEKSVRSRMLEEREKMENGKKMAKERSVSPKRESRRNSRDRSRSPDGKTTRRRSRSRSRSPYRNRNRDRGGRYDRRDRYDRGRYSRDYDRRRRRSRSRTRSRSRSRSRGRDSREREKDQAKAGQDRNAKINLDDWAPKQASGGNLTKIDPTLASIKEKMRLREEEEKEKQRIQEQNKMRWAAVSTDNDKNEAAQDTKEPIVGLFKDSANRPQVAIQIRHQTRDKTTPDPSSIGSAVVSAAKKPMVGKMPWMKRSRKSEEPADEQPKPKSRFGPPSTSATLPPPTVLTNVPAPTMNQPPPAVKPPTTLVSEYGEKPKPKLPDPPKEALDYNSLLQAAHAHMMTRNERGGKFYRQNLEQQYAAMAASYSAEAQKKQMQPTIAPPVVTQPAVVPAPTAVVPPAAPVPSDNGGGDVEIPLPPLPAAQDKDPDALMDTRPPKIPTPPPPVQKSEMELMIEKHQQSEQQPQVQGYDYSNYYDYYSAYQQQMPVNPPPLPSTPHPDEKKKMKAKVEEKEKPPGDDGKEPDESELAMLGIDPSDFAGFGK